MSVVGVLAAVAFCVSVALLAAKIVRWRVWLLPRRALVVLALVAALATLQAQKGGGPMRSAPVPGGDATSAPVMEESVRVVTNLCCTAINVSSNEVELVYAWPEDYFAAGDILDLFASTNLAAPCEWSWCVDHSIAEGETNWTEQVDLADFAAGTNPPPAALFFKAVLRVAPDDLRDSDRDGLPDVYEFHNGTHPYVPDYESAPKRVVVDSVPSLAAALAASEPYSVIELAGRTDYDLSGRSLDVPEWPVMVWCRDGYATIRSTGTLVFVIDKTVNGDSLFKNLHLSLEASSGFQAGFWLGPGWVMNGTNSAAANFEDIYIRMPNAGTEYFGWHYYRANENVSRFERCVVNATGSDWAHGIYSYDGPPMEVEGCTFMGFSSSGRNSFGVYLESSRDNVGGMSGETAVGIRNCVFDEGFANAHCYSFISSEKGTNYWVWMDNCLVPNGFVSGQDPDEQTAICHTNAELAAYGFPAEDSPVARMGLGALSVLSPSDVTDRDGDGLTDYAEAYVHGTDPWLRDSDYDGVDDFTELDIDHTDPLNVNSFVRRVAVTLTNRVVHAGVTNYVAFGNSAHGWETNGVVWSSTGAFASNCFDEVSINGAGYARAYQDLNRNGVYDAAADILLVSPLPVKSLAKVAFSFGDVDGDGVADDVERMEGTDPYDGKNFKVSFAVEISGVFHTTNNLSVGVFMNGQMQYGPEVVATNVWTHETDWIVSNGMVSCSFRFWDDADSNGVWNAAETYVDQYFTVKNGRVAVTNRLSYGNFDRDRDNLPDWWEVTHGLSDNGPKSDEYSDPDEDGLINLHEYWAGTDPHVPDGSNTLLSACTRSVDDRLVGIDPPNDTWRFVDFFRNASNGVFVVNTNLWCKGVDLSCVSVWHREEYSYETRGTQTATAVTRRHVLISNHWNSNQYRFCDTNGNVFVREHDRRVVIHGDTLLARLTVPLPESIVPAKLLPDDYAGYLTTGKYVPSICVNEMQQVVVGDIESLDTEINGYQHYGKVAATNVVTEFRERIRSSVNIGQSSSPVFLMMGNTPILLLLKHLGVSPIQWNPTWGPSLPHFVDKIQRAIDSWEGAGAYSLDVVDLSEFEPVRSDL